MMKTLSLALFAQLLTLAASALAQSTGVDVERLPCFEVGKHSAVVATVANDVPGGEVRLYFRRLHEEVEDFYYVRMISRGGGEYWAAFPQPDADRLEKRELDEDAGGTEGDDDGQTHAAGSEEKWARWWRQKEIEVDRDPNNDLDTRTIEERAALGRLMPRDWMASLDDTELQEWLEQSEYEPVEYFVGLYDGFGNEVARTGMMAVPVSDDCPRALTAQEEGMANNLTIGESAEWQRGQQPFHWQCDGVVTRIDPFGVMRGDGACRACVIAWWKTTAFLVPLAAATAVGTGIILLGEDEEASPFQP